MASVAQVWLWGIDLADAPTEAQHGDGSGLLDPGEAESLAVAMGLPLSEVTARLAWSRCHVGRADGRIVSYCWVSRVETPIGEIAATIVPNPGEAYIWDCATLPEYRRQGRFAKLLRHLVGAFAADNLRWAWIGTVEGNPAVSAVEHAGFHRVLLVRHASDGERSWSVEPAVGANPQELAALRDILKLAHKLPSAP